MYTAVGYVLYALSVSWFFFFFKQKTAYEMRISDWSSDVCSSDLRQHVGIAPPRRAERRPLVVIEGVPTDIDHRVDRTRPAQPAPARLVADPAVQPFLRHRIILIVRRFGDEGNQARRLDPDNIVGPAGLDQTNGARPHLRQPRKNGVKGQ